MKNKHPANARKKITTLIGKAIREGKYLNISYKNKNGEVTAFWISILDINDKGELRVNLFNVTPAEGKCTQQFSSVRPKPCVIVLYLTNLISSLLASATPHRKFSVQP